MTDDQWAEELRHVAASVRPVGSPAVALTERVRRRSRRRAQGLVAGAVLGLVAVVGGTSVLGGGTAAAPVADVGPTPSAPTPAPEEPFSCPTYDDVDRVVPPVPDLDEQEAIVRAARRPTKDFAVTDVRATHLGVVAMVEGSLPFARARLGELGVAHVFKDVWDSADAGQAVQWILRPVLGEVRRATRGLGGGAGLAFWDAAGAVVVRWKAPVPTEVAALAGRRPDGVTVVVEETAYSTADVRRAQGRLQDFLRESGLRETWSSSYACHDGSGLVVGMRPAVADDAGLAARLADAVGMPVRVLPEERPVPTGLVPPRR